jgi:hypothetical protein
LTQVSVFGYIFVPIVTNLNFVRLTIDINHSDWTTVITLNRY